MKDRTVVVTGANRGIGLELCRQLSAAGARCVGTARDPDGAEELRDVADRVEALDVSDASSVSAFAERLGELTVDVLVNNAGIGSSGPGVADLDVDEAMNVFNVNSLGPLRVTQALLPHLRRGTTRKVVQISSIMGSIGDNAQGGYYAYRTSKTALNMLTKTLALELAGQGFICVMLHPGWVRTRLGGDQAPLSVEESVRGLVRVIDRVERQGNGLFLDHTGERLPW